MEAKEVLALACEYLRDYQLKEILENDNTDSVSDGQESKIKLLVTSLNDVVQTLALMYFPLKKTENIKSDTGEYKYEDFEKIVLEVIKVYDRLGNAVKYKCYPESMHTGLNEINVTYHYQPDFVENMGDKLNVAYERVSLRMLVTGVLARYYMYQGMYQESTAWERAFQTTILAAKSSNHTQALPRRSWY
ncbi:MAG: hypothetical protein IKC79_03795 [Clostridia bacterium]|nr:hypothetical protein [Clostridia bacterium]